jgi:hypothetical protein
MHFERTDNFNREFSNLVCKATSRSTLKIYLFVVAQLVYAAAWQHNHSYEDQFLLPDYPVNTLNDGESRSVTRNAALEVV